MIVTYLSARCWSTRIVELDGFAVVANNFPGRNAFDVFWKWCSLSNTGLNWTQREEEKLKERFECELQKVAVCE
jgi:hypothetical protein